MAEYEDKSETSSNTLNRYKSPLCHNTINKDKSRSSSPSSIDPMFYEFKEHYGKINRSSKTLLEAFKD